MTLVEKLRDFAGALASATDAPDGYLPGGYVSYESNMEDLKSLWREIKPMLKKDVDSAEFIDLKLHLAFECFELGMKQEGRQAIWDIYNMGVKSLR